MPGRLCFRWSGILVLFALLLGLTSPVNVIAQPATPASSPMSELAAPFGVGTVPIPETQQAVSELFEVMMSPVAGQTAASISVQPDRIEISYGTPEAPFGPPMRFSFISFPPGDFFPDDFTPARYVGMATTSGEYQNVTAGRDGELVWMQSELSEAQGGDKPGTPEASRTLYTLVWGLADASWMLMASADTPEGLAALAGAYVDAAQVLSVSAPWQKR